MILNFAQECILIDMTLISGYFQRKKRGHDADIIEEVERFGKGSLWPGLMNFIYCDLLGKS